MSREPNTDLHERGRKFGKVSFLLFLLFDVYENLEIRIPVKLYFLVVPHGLGRIMDTFDTFEPISFDGMQGGSSPPTIHYHFSRLLMISSDHVAAL